MGDGFIKLKPSQEETHLSRSKLSRTSLVRTTVRSSSKRIERTIPMLYMVPSEYSLAAFQYLELSETLRQSVKSLGATPTL